jgi:RNA polymerase sigma-70 factor (ECF subfamily)
LPQTKIARPSPLASTTGGEETVAATLAESLAAGDPDAFAALYDRLAFRLLGAARTMTASAADAEDVVQDLFVALARGRARLAAVADLEAYVFTMLRNAIRRRGRRAAIDRRAVLAIAEDRRDTGAHATAAAELPDDELAAAVAALPEAQREVVALKIDAGLTFAEIAAVTGTSLNTAASRYRYALEKLRTALADPEED